MATGKRSLKTLIEEFDKVSQLDSQSRTVTGETYWLEVDGVRTRLVEAWLTGLSAGERAAFYAYLNLPDN
jgi:hypothetical protein